VRRTHPLQERDRLCLSIRITQIAFAILCLFLCVPRDAAAQANAGITGTVTDPSGAVIPGASVTITDEATSIANHAVTSSAGTYTVRGLTPAKYTIVVEAKGFKKAVQKDVNVEVSTIDTIDFALTTGAASDTIEVTASAIALNTTQPQLGSTIDPETTKSLPVEVSGRGRQVDSLQFLAPGTTGSTFSHRVSGGVDFEQEIVYNGIPAPQPETEGYTTNFNPPFDLVDEVRVERSTFAAQFGLGQGALTYQMKSGTNRYHGALFEINRNSLFDSVGFFNEKGQGGSGEVPTDHENNYGFDIGGPIRIPHLYDGRDKTYGHYSQEWYKQNEENTNISTVPTAQEKTGNFSDLINSSGNLIPIYDPTTGLPFPGNIIPSSRISATSASLIPDIPDPDRPGSGPNGLLSNKSAAANAYPNLQHVWGFVVDQKLTDRQSIHYSEWRNSYNTTSFDYNPLVVVPNPLNSMKTDPTLGSIFLLNYTNAITPHLAMTAGFGWIGELNNQFNLSKGATFSAVTDENIPPNISFGPSSNECQSNTYTCWGTSGSWYQSINRKLGIAIVNNWLWTKGRHTFNIGGEFRRTYQDDNEEQTEGGHFNFSSNQTSTPNSNYPNFGNYGNAFASFLLGLPDAANRSNSQELRLRNLDLSPYVQDDIKLTPRLTLNVGLRWDIQVPFTENNNLIVFFNPDITDPAAIGSSGPIAGGATKFGNCTGCAGYTRANTHFTHLGPRFGFAYKLSEKSVLQAGFSVAFLDGGAYEYGTNKVAVNDSNLLTGSFVRSSTGSSTSSFGSWDTNSLPSPSPVPFSNGLGGGQQIEAFNINDGYAPYSQQWNVNYQRELPYDTFVTAAWVGNRVIHLPSQNNKIDQMNPAYDSQYGNAISACQAAQGLGQNSVLTDTFATVAQGGNGCATVDGFSSPYANFVSDFGGSSSVAQSLVPYPQYSYIFNNFEGSGTTYYQSIQVEFDKRFSRGLSFLVGYTLSHLMDNTNSGFSSFTAGGINKYNQKPEWAVSTSDEPQTLKVSGTYELPIGPHKPFFNNHGVTGQLLGGWQVGWILDYEAGAALGVTESGEPYPNSSNRPNRLGGVHLGTASYSRALKQFLTGDAEDIFNPAAFATTSTQYVIGDSIRNYGAIRGTPLYDESLNARKKFFFGERFTGILAVDYFNAFNRTQFNNPDTLINDSTFGQVVSAGTPGNYPANRQGQVTFRLEF